VAFRSDHMATTQSPGHDPVTWPRPSHMATTQSHGHDPVTWPRPSHMATDFNRGMFCNDFETLINENEP
jgi:hypothetical protein